MPIRFLRFFIPFFLGFIAVAGVSHAQQAKIQVLDNKTGQAVSYGNVCFESLDGSSKTYQVTDENGKVDNLVKSRSLVASGSSPRGVARPARCCGSTLTPCH